MKWRRCLRSLLLGAAASILIASAWAQQTGQTGAGSTGGNPNGNKTNNPPGSTGTSGNTNQSRTNPDSSGNFRRDGQFRRTSTVEVTGRVVLEDGSAAPVGAIVQRDCSGRVQKVADVATDGSFWFEVGGNTRSIIADASEPGPGTQMVATGTPPGFREFDTGALTGLAGCELRADLGGYRSNALLITSSLTMGPVDVGTIVLYPASRISGTTVSVADLAAPKDAKKALARAQKAVQKGKPEDAEKDLEAAVATYPKYAGAWFQLGQLYEQAHRVADARDAFSKALEADGKYVRPYIGLARLAAKEQKWQETLNLSSQALELDPLDFPDGLYLNALANYYLKNLDVAEGSLRRVQRLDPNHRLPQSHLLLAGILNKKRDLAGEVEQLRYYLKYAPQAVDAAQVRARLQDLEKASASIR